MHYFGDSVTASGSAAAPTSGSAVASVANTSLSGKGVYRVRVRYVLSGTAETAVLNIRLKYNGSTTIAFPTVGATSTVQDQQFVLSLDGTNAVRLEAAANATAGSVYTGIIEVDRIH